MESTRKSRLTETIVTYIVLAVLVFVALFPFYWMGLTTDLGSYIMGDVFLWGPLMATALLTTIPPIILFMAVQRYVVSGMTLGSVKG